jgi:hypothetical protein
MTSTQFCPDRPVDVVLDFGDSLEKSIRSSDSFGYSFTARGTQHFATSKLRHVSLINSNMLSTATKLEPILRILQL